MNIKPIKTMYKNTKFRSRLEARWAVFFDCLKINWVYEDEGYDLGNGIWYLPDFYLPTFDGGLHVEVKHEKGNFDKPCEFVKQTKKSIWLAKGIPDIKVYRVLRWEEPQCKCCQAWVNSEQCIPNWDQAYGEDRMFGEPGYEDEQGYMPEEYWPGNQHYVDAVIKACGCEAFDK